MSEPRKVAEAFPLGDFLREEMEAREWDSADVAVRMGGDLDAMAKNLFVVELLLAVCDPKLILDEDNGKKLARAFGVDETFFLNLDRSWREWCAGHPEFDWHARAAALGQ